MEEIRRPLIPLCKSQTICTEISLHEDVISKSTLNNFFSIFQLHCSCAISSCLTRSYHRILYYIFCRIPMGSVY